MRDMAHYKASEVMIAVDGLANELHHLDWLAQKLCEAGRSIETVGETLDRLLRERESVCRLLNRSGAVNFDDPGFKCSFDVMVPRFLKPSKRDLRKKRPKEFT